MADTVPLLPPRPPFLVQGRGLETLRGTRPSRRLGRYRCAPSAASALPPLRVGLAVAARHATITATWPIPFRSFRRVRHSSLTGRSSRRCEARDRHGDVADTVPLLPPRPSFLVQGLR